MDIERLAAQADTLLLIEHRTAVFNLDRQRHDQHDRRAQNDCNRRHHEIKHAFLNLCGGGVLRQADCHDAHTLNVAHLCGMFGNVKRRGNQRNLEVHGFHLQSKSAQIIGEAVEHIGDHHRLRAGFRNSPSQLISVFNHVDRGIPRLMHFLAEQFGVRIRLNESSLTIDPNRAQTNGLVIELLALVA